MSTNKEMEVRVFNILKAAGCLQTIHDITEGMPIEIQEDAIEAADELVNQNVAESYAQFARSCAMILLYQLKKGYEDTEWYKTYIRKSS